MNMLWTELSYNDLKEARRMVSEQSKETIEFALAAIHDRAIQEALFEYIKKND